MTLILPVLRIRFRWFPRFGSAKICGSIDPDPRGKLSNLTAKKLITELITVITRDYQNKSYR